MRVEEVAQSILAQMCAEGTPAIEQKYRDSRAEALPEWLDQIDPPPRRESTLVPPGFVYVDAVLPKHQAFLARKWAEQTKEKVKKARAAMFNAREEVVEGPMEFKKGLRCEVVQVHHKVFEDNIGKKVIITEVRPDTRQVWAHDGKPIRYRTNRNGRRVVDHDPRCINSIYGFDDLKVLDSQEKNKR